MPRLKRFKWDALARRAYEAWQRDQPEAISFDVETDGVNWSHRPFCMTVAWENEAHYIELGDFVREVICCEMLAYTPTLIAHNAKFDMRMMCNVACLVRERLTWSTFEDTETLAQLLDHDRLKGLKPLSKSVLNRTTDEDDVLKVVCRKLKLKKDDGYHLLPREVIIPYAISDARNTFDLWKVLLPQLEAKPNLVSLYEQERKLTLVLLDMEIAGMATDLEYARAAVKEYGTKVIQAQQAIDNLLGIKGFNPNSPKQVLAAFASVGIHLKSTGKDVLADVDHPLVGLLTTLRKVSKLRSTYLVPMVDETFEGVLHPNLRQHGTKTGRMSSGEADNND